MGGVKNLFGSAGGVNQLSNKAVNISNFGSGSGASPSSNSNKNKNKHKSKSQPGKGKNTKACTSTSATNDDLLKLFRSTVS